MDTDSDRALWASRFATDVRLLDWSADGERLLALSVDFMTVLDARGRFVGKGPTAGGAQAAAFSPTADRVALVRTVANAKAGRSEVVVVDPTTFEERRLSAPGDAGEATSPRVSGWCCTP